MPGGLGGSSPIPTWPAGSYFARMDETPSAAARLALAHVIALVGTAVLAGILYLVLLGNVDPYASHTNGDTARTSAALVLVLYCLFTAGLAGVRRVLRLRLVPMSSSVYAWAVLTGPPVLFVATLGFASTY